MDDYNHNFEATFKFWDDLLLRFGKRISAVGGSDMHNLHGVSSSLDLNGSYDTLLGDIVSLPSNTQVDFQITLDGDDTTGQVTAVEQEFVDNINEQLETRKNYSSTLEAITNKADSSHDLVVVIKNGLFLNAWLINRRAMVISQRLAVNGSERSYYRAELYGKSGRLAVTNPGTL